MLVLGTPGITHFRPADGLPRVFCGTSMIAKEFVPEKGIKPFAIMKCLLRYHVRNSHPSLRAHSPRALGVFTDERVIVHIYFCIMGLHAHGKPCR
jgi:hypothetical protein